MADSDRNSKYESVRRWIDRHYSDDDCSTNDALSNDGHYGSDSRETISSPSGGSGLSEVFREREDNFSNPDLTDEEYRSDANLYLDQNSVLLSPLKRNYDSFGRNVTKKIKLDDPNDVKYGPNEAECVSIVSDYFNSDDYSEPEITRVCGENAVPNYIPITTEKKKIGSRRSVEMHKVKKHDTSTRKPNRFEKSSEPSGGLQLFDSNDRMIIKPWHFLDIGIDDYPEDPEITIEESAGGSVQNDIESEIETEIYSTSRNERVERSEPTQENSVTVECESEMLSSLMDLDLNTARNIVILFKKGYTIPFIARYRRQITNGMDVDQLIKVKCTYDYIKSSAQKAISFLENLNVAGLLNEILKNRSHRVKSIEDLNQIFSQYKPNASRSRAEKARSLGLEKAAFQVLNGTGEFNPASFVNRRVEGIKNTNQVIQSVQHILTEIFSKDEAVLELIRKIENEIPITVQSSKKETEDAVQDEDGKLRKFYKFTRLVNNLTPNQVLALNRGDDRKILTVKMSLGESFYDKLYSVCYKKWIRHGQTYGLRNTMFEQSLKDCYTRQIVPMVIRRTKAKLTRNAQAIAIENFASNLKSLLRTQPVKGCSILGIDPGPHKGVKFALISSQGDVLWTSVMNFNPADLDASINQENMDRLKRNMVKYRCELIAIGNGRGTKIETILSNYLKKKFFSPELNVRYTCVTKRGTSAYSCSPTARKEFPYLVPDLISAVFIARSIQDPLNEYVKVEPKHLGLGMYQHDIPEVKLNQCLNEVVSECVSFTGIDLNTASIHLLKRVAGLGDIRAANIIKWRQEKGPFKNRQQLLEVDQIGPKTFEQCSGFLRIHPQTCNVRMEDLKKIGKPKNTEYNPLDSTWIHPESYYVAYRFIEHCCDSRLFEFGTPSFIRRIKRVVELEGIKTISETLGQTEETILFIYEALTRPNDYDYRNEFSKPIFSDGLERLRDLSVDDIHYGVVTNVTSFGAFVDLEGGETGLIHKKNFNRIKVRTGDNVEVQIETLDKSSKRITLLLLRKI